MSNSYRNAVPRLYLVPKQHPGSLSPLNEFHIIVQLKNLVGISVTICVFSSFQVRSRNLWIDNSFPAVEMQDVLEHESRYDTQGTDTLK